MVAGDMRGLAGIQAELRRNLRERVETIYAKYEAAEETGRSISFPNLDRLVEFGGSLGELLEALRPEDVANVPNEFVPLLLDGKLAQRRLRPADIKQALGQVPPKDAPLFEAGKSRGGRPPLPHWEELVIDTIRPIFLGDWKPKTVDEIVGRMQEWLIARGVEQSYSETALKQRARKIRDSFLKE